MGQSLLGDRGKGVRAMLGMLNDEQIDQLLRRQVVGRLGCHANGQTYVVPITYAYDGEYIYARSMEGLKLQFMRVNPQVCFEVDLVDDLANWQSVIAFGTFEELHGAAAEVATQRLVSRLLSRAASQTSELARDLLSQPQPQRPQPREQEPPMSVVVYRIHLSQRTGRFEHEYGTSLGFQGHVGHLHEQD